MTEQLANSLYNPTTTLDGAITDTATSLVVADVSELPTTGEFRILIWDGTTDGSKEVVKVGAINTGTKTLSSLTREAENASTSPARAHGDGALVELVMTAGGVGQYVFENSGSATIGAVVVTTTTTSVVTGGDHIPFDTVYKDSDSFWDAGNSRFVIPTGLDGLYLINVYLELVDEPGLDAAGLSVVGPYTLNAPVVLSEFGIWLGNLSVLLPLVGGDTLYVDLAASGGGSISTVDITGNCLFSISSFGDI